MSPRRKAVVALATVAVIACAWWLWPRNVYRYQGKTVEEWFRERALSTRSVSVWLSIDSFQREPHARAWKAFEKMGTNAVPFLASRINQYPTPSLLDEWANKLPARFRPVSRNREAVTAAMLLEAMKPPRNMLAELHC